MADEKVTIHIKLNETDIKKGIKGIETQVGKTAKNVEGKLSKALTGGFTKAAKTIAGFGAAFLGFHLVREAVDNLSSFSKAVAEVSTIVPDAVKVNEAFKNSLIDVSAQFGTSATAQAKTFYQIISAGVTDVTKANQLLITSNKLAIAGLADVAGAVDLLTTVLKSYEKQNLDAATAADILFTTVKLGKTTMEALQSSLGLIVPTASAIGVSFGDTAAAVATLATVTGNTSVAVTQLDAVFTGVLKKQDMAAKMGKRVANAFSLQALKTKGLTKFLRDLNDALGGSEEKLIKLLGRAEGAKAIMGLAGDGFKSLEKNVDGLKKSLGANEAAFQKMANTIDFQILQLKSSFEGLVLKFTTQDEGPFVSVLKDINKSLLDMLKNFSTVQEDFVRRIKSMALAFVAAFLLIRGPAGIMGFITSLIKVNAFLVETAAGFTVLKFRGVTTFKAIQVAAISAGASMQALRATVTALKIAISLGLLIALDALINKFLKLQDLTGSVSGAFKIMFMELKILFMQFSVGINAAFASLAEKIPGLGKSIAKPFNDAATTAYNSVLTMQEQLRLLVDSYRLAQEELASQGPLNPFKDKDTGKTLGDSAMEAAEAVGYASGLISISITKSLTEGTKQFNKFQKAVNKTMKQGVVNTISKSMQSVVGAIMSGGDAFGAFAKSVAGTMGELAIQLGQMFIMAGISVEAMKVLGGASAIVAGLALVAVGTILKSMSGGGAAASAPVGGGGGVTGIPPSEGGIDADPEEVEQRDPETRVQVVVHGDILDSKDTGLRILDILNANFDNEGGRLAVT